MTLYVGLMSGTSMDGIDAALTEIPSNRLVYGITKKYSADLHNRLELMVQKQIVNLGTLSQINTLIGREFADAVNDLLQEANVKPEQVRAIGSHGQTVCHDSTDSIPYTLQLGCAHTISTRTGIDVVADFRTRDLVNGGQGAPFAPLYHHELFSKSGKNTAVVNIGGISNVTFVCPDQPTKGWDVGPGNCLIDGWIYRHLGKSYDESGQWAQKGTIIDSLLNQMLNDSFFNKPTPKSIGKEYFSLLWLERFLIKEFAPADVQSTLVALTAHSIANTIKDHQKMDHLYLCGGGVHNSYLVEYLQRLLPGLMVASTADAGVSPDYVEAMMFAWLGAKTINKKAVDLSAITGSRTPAILGALYPATKPLTN